MNKKEMNNFWKKEIKHKFTKECLNFKVTTSNGKKIRYVNLDNAATTSPFKKVKENVDKFLDAYGSVHRGSGQKSEISTTMYENAREYIAKSVGANKDYYIILTKNTTEAINHIAELMHFTKGKILVSDIEHSSNLLPWLKYNKTVIYKTNEKNQIDYDNLINIFEKHKNNEENNKIKLLTVVGASNVTGYKPDIYKLARIAHKYGAFILIDACQLLQHEKIKVGSIKDKSHLDFVAFSGHKMYAPYGGGCLVGPKKFFDKTKPYQIGGGNLAYITSDFTVKKYDTVQTHDPGTPNAVGIISMADSMKELNDIGMNKIIKYEHSLINYAFAELKKIEGLTIHSDQKNEPSMILFDINEFDYRLTAEILAKEFGIGTRAGAFCVYQLLRKLKNISPKEDKKISVEVEKGKSACMPGIVRASFAIYNNVEDVDRLVKSIKKIIVNGKKYYSKKYKQDKITGEFRLK